MAKAPEVRIGPNLPKITRPMPPKNATKQEEAQQRYIRMIELWNEGYTETEIAEIVSVKADRVHTVLLAIWKQQNPKEE